MENVKITLSNNKASKDKAYVEVREGRLVAKFKVVDVGGNLYLNNPGRFVDTLKGRPLAGGKTHTGRVDDVYITDKKFRQEILSRTAEMISAKDAA